MSKTTTKDSNSADLVPDSSQEEAENSSHTESSSLMGGIIKTLPNPPRRGEIVEGPVIAIDKASVFIDLPPAGTGIIYGREFINARSIIRNINIGDTIAAKVVEEQNAEGYVELSLKEARQAIVWAEAEEAIKEGRIFSVPVTDANKGGLMLEWQGIVGFLPASQLKPEHYPRVEDGDKTKILNELNKLIGEKLAVSIITAAPRDGKLIFSEKEKTQEKSEEVVGQYEVGDVIEGEITGIVDFGVFIKVQEGLEGLAHISELDWALVEDPKELFRVGETVKAKIIEIKDGKISLSIKALKDNPWNDAKGKYEKGKQVDGVIIKFNKHGALASIEEGVAGLVHVSEFGSEEKLRETLELGRSYPFTITLFDADKRRMTLSYGAMESK
jgi:small subunit ribosomal protein S1